MAFTVSAPLIPARDGNGGGGGGASASPPGLLHLPLLTSPYLDPFSFGSLVRIKETYQKKPLRIVNSFPPRLLLLRLLLLALKLQPPLPFLSIQPLKA